MPSPRSFAALLMLATAVRAQEAPVRSDYVVLAGFAAEDPFDAAVQVLARHHRARVLRFDPANVAPLLPDLVAAAPRYVALVLRPEQIGFGLQRRFLELATRLDADPFVDFAFGYVTGRDAAAAVALARRGIERKPHEATSIALAAGGCAQSSVQSVPFLLRQRRLDSLQILGAGDDRTRDLPFWRTNLPKLHGRDVVTFAGHGYPHEIVGGPTFAELVGLDLAGSVVLNVACYTGVTGPWFEDDHGRGIVAQREVASAESFCLAVLDTGVLGYTAYLSPRPAGPELETDLAALVATGLSLGDARRRDYDKTVLGVLGFGEERLQPQPIGAGAKLPAAPDDVRDIMLEGATGGVVFGDPACVPFVAMSAEEPVSTTVQLVEHEYRIKARCPASDVFLHCSDPTARWGQTMAMRVYGRTPIQGHVVDFVVDELRIGGKVQPTRVLWAIEDDHGERFLQWKVNFPRDGRANGALLLTARVLTTADEAAGKRRGGEVRRRSERSPDVRSRELQPFLLPRAAAREVSPEAMQAALDASAALLGVEGAPADALERLRARKSEGFRAVCVLIEVGHVHVATWQLLHATWQPGDERHLLGLASQPELPQWGMWAALGGLSCADTPAVRAFLLARLPNETDSGHAMSIAEALARLGERSAVAPIAAHVLAFRSEWSGVEADLLQAVATIGGPDAVRQLEAIGRHAGCTRPDRIAQLLDRLDRAAAERVRAERGR
ncbi:MAG: hypothetical protein JNK15_11465 [Planctomycetes bacterium]|nr:hypothetical protein [Planctomycetota bacterium]